MAPPGTEAPHGPRWNHVGEKSGSVGHALVAQMVALARQQPELHDASANKISRLVRNFIAAGLHERDLVAWVTGYADPTGTEAVRNVMRERRIPTAGQVTP